MPCKNRSPFLVPLAGGRYPASLLSLSFWMPPQAGLNCFPVKSQPSAKTMVGIGPGSAVYRPAERRVKPFAACIQCPAACNRAIHPRIHRSTHAFYLHSPEPGCERFFAGHLHWQSRWFLLTTKRRRRRSYFSFGACAFLKTGSGRSPPPLRRVQGANPMDNAGPSLLKRPAARF